MINEDTSALPTCVRVSGCGNPVHVNLWILNVAAPYVVSIAFIQIAIDSSSFILLE